MVWLGAACDIACIIARLFLISVRMNGLGWIGHDTDSSREHIPTMMLVGVVLATFAAGLRIWCVITSCSARAARPEFEKLPWQVFQYAWPVLHLRDYNPAKAPPHYSRAVRVGPPPKLHGRLSHAYGGDARARRARVVDGCVRRTHRPWRAGRAVLGGEVYFRV